MGMSDVVTRVGDANHVSVFLWRPREEDDSWVLVKPPAHVVVPNSFHLRDLGFRSMTSMKLFGMGGYGPKRDSMRSTAY